MTAMRTTTIIAPLQSASTIRPRSRPAGLLSVGRSIPFALALALGGIALLVVLLVLLPIRLLRRMLG